jgi:serine/threonine-protein kinase
LQDADLLAAEQRVGRVLHEKWTLERLLGVGGTAAVYLGRHRNGARHAVKVLHAHLSQVHELRERFRREGYAANRVEHPGAVRVLDDDVVRDASGETAYIVMELLDGESLADRMDRAPAVGERDVLVVLDGVLDVLKAAHARGVLHRDLKPDNIFLANDPDGGPARIKILDFGLARIAERERVTQTGQAFGTPSFMSPEQAAGRTREIDERTDIFAVGATAFRILASRCVHEADNALAIMLKMATVPAPSLRSVAPHVSAQLASIVDLALEFRPENRYASAEAMKIDVERALANPEPPAPRISRAPEPTVPVLVAAETPPPPLPARRRSYIPHVTVALYAMIAAGELLAPSHRSPGVSTTDSADPSATANAPAASRRAAAPPSRTAAPATGTRVAPKGSAPVPSQRTRTQNR